MIRLLTVATALLYGSLAFAYSDKRVVVVIEEPVQGGYYSGISNLRGYAVSKKGMGAYFHEVWIDDEFAFYLAPYGQRTDVGNAFPDYPDSDTGGFSMAFNYKNLSPGEHEIAVCALDNAERRNCAVATFTAERFETEFIASDSDVDVGTMSGVSLYDDQTFLVSGPTLEGKQWDFLLRWDKASQSFKTEEILPWNGSGTELDSGRDRVYACVTTPVSGLVGSGSEVVQMRNGAELYNYDGRAYYGSTPYVIFQTKDGKWYALRDTLWSEGAKRIDLTREPDACFEPDFYFIESIAEEDVQQSARDVEALRFELSNGDTLFIDPDRATCNISAVQKRAPIIYKEYANYGRFVDLDTAESCMYYFND